LWKIKNLFKAKLFRNFSILYSYQLVLNITSLITVPYLARVLGPEQFGILILALALGAMISPVSEYGFEFTATREVSKNRTNSEILKKVASNVIFTGVFLSVVATLLIVLLSLLIESLKDEYLLIFFLALYVSSSSLGPWWYFQGVEELNYPTRVSILLRLMAVALIFILVNNPSDTWIVIALYAVSKIIGMTILIVRLFKSIGGFITPDLKDMVNTLQTGKNIFFYKLSSTLYTHANIYLLGLLTNPSIVAFYGAAEKVIKVLRQIIITTTKVAFPRLSYLVTIDINKAIVKRNQITLILLSITTLLVSIIWFNSELIIYLFLGDGYTESVIVLKYLSISMIAFAISNTYGSQWLLAINKDKSFTKIILVGVVINIVILLFLVPRYQHIGLAITYLIVEFYMAASFYIVNRNYEKRL